MRKYQELPIFVLFHFISVVTLEELGVGWGQWGALDEAR
jgi:hypothetical protein